MTNDPRPPADTAPRTPADVSDLDTTRAAPRLDPREEKFILGGMRVAQRALLVLVAVLTALAALVEIWQIAAARTIDLASILLMFLYAEVIAMAAVFYAGHGKTFVFPIFIAVTALARLIVIQGKDMDPVNILFEAGAILLLAVAAVVLLRLTGKERWR